MVSKHLPHFMAVIISEDCCCWSGTLCYPCHVSRLTREGKRLSCKFGSRTRTVVLLLRLLLAVYCFLSGLNGYQ